MRHLWIITGTPGVGKTFLGRALARRLRLPFLDLGAFVRTKHLYSAVDRERRSIIVDEALVQVNLAEELVDGGVVATHFLGRIFPRTAGRAVVLRLDPIVLWTRLRARGWSRTKAWENVESELVDVCYSDAVMALGKKRVYELDTTGRRRTQVLDQTLRLVDVERGGGVRPVDWLGIYDPIALERRLRRGQTVSHR